MATTVKVQDLTNTGNFAIGDTFVGERTTGTTVRLQFSGTLLDGDLNNIFKFTPTTSAVNYINVTNAATSGSPIVSAVGTDTNINLILQSQGTGSVNLKSANTSTAIKFQTGTSYQHTTSFSFTDSSNARTITVPDVSGTMTILGNSSTGSGSIVLDTGATISSATLTQCAFDTFYVSGTSNKVLDTANAASAVNYVKLTNAATGMPAIIGGAGTDSNVSLALSAQAAGQVLFKSTAASPIAILSGTGYQHTTTFSITNNSNSRTITIPDATGTMTLLGNSTTGSGDVVLATAPTISSPILVTPALGTPSSGTLTSCTGLPLSSGVTGTLPIANGGTNGTTAAAARGNLAIGFGQMQAFTSGGTFTPSANTTSVFIRMWGAGGGGGGGGSGSVGAGGAGGGYTEGFVTVTPSSGVTVTVGAGGSGGAAGGNGGNGGFSSFSTLTANGGNGGTNGGGASTGGTASGGTLNLSGQNGQTASTAYGGDGGNSPMNPGSGPGGRNAATAGTAAMANSGGGGGGSGQVAGGTGGAGAAGLVLVYY